MSSAKCSYCPAIAPESEMRRTGQGLYLACRSCAERRLRAIIEGVSIKGAAKNTAAA